jgi:predicted transcriptional regulator of viral defense system
MYLDHLESRGRGYFTKQSALAEVELTPSAFQAAITRQKQNGRLVSPRRGFYVIIRPEDRLLGAPDPANWIDPLMTFQKVDYRISMLRAAAFHGSSHQAAMVFQVIAPLQLSSLVIGRQRMEFLYQSPVLFAECNQEQWLTKLKSPAGFAKIAGVELTLLDHCRYFHQAGGISTLAQVVKDLGQAARPQVLAKIATHFENSVVRRLGYLLECAGHLRQARVLRPFAQVAKSYKPLDPAVARTKFLPDDPEAQNSDWKLILNVPVELDF